MGTIIDSSSFGFMADQEITSEVNIDLFVAHLPRNAQKLLLLLVLRKSAFSIVADYRHLLLRSVDHTLMSLVVVRRDTATEEVMRNLAIKLE